MLTVHHLDDSRSQRLLWLLEELELDYQLVEHRRDPRTLRAPQALRQVHPLGKAPVLIDGDRVVAESGAIIEHVLEAHGGGRLRPEVGTPEHDRYRYWLHHAEGSAMGPLVQSIVFSELPRQAPLLARPLMALVDRMVHDQYLLPEIRRYMDFWEQHLQQHQWFAGEALTGADIAMSFPLESVVSNGRAGASEYGAISAFVARIHERPAYRRALERGGPYAYGPDAT